MEKVTDNDVTLMWFDKLVEAQRNYLELANGTICLGLMDTDIHFSSSCYEEYCNLAKLLGKEIERNEDRDAKDKYIGYRFPYEEFRVTCLIDNPDYIEEEENNG